jgi:hypothetical protein
MTRHLLRYGIQLLATLAILAWLPGNAAKVVALVVWWGITFGPLGAGEWALFIAACVFFTGMDLLALQQGTFAFTNPDLWGLPYYEFLMWGFYLVHGYRVLGGTTPGTRWAPILTATVVYAAAHALVRDPILLTGITAVALIAALFWFHEPADLAYAGYFTLLGLVVELTGVSTGQWGYPGDPLLHGIPLWFVPLWAGIGLFLRRLVLPAGEICQRLTRPSGPGNR